MSVRADTCKVAVACMQRLASPNQRYIWRLHTTHSDPAIYNITIVHRLEGKVDAQALNANLRHIMLRHEGLRSAFRLNDAGDLEWQVVDLGNWHLVEHDNQSMTQDAFDACIRRELSQPFDISVAPLFRACLFRSRTSNVLTIVVHHICFDAWSTSVLIGELNLLYRASLMGVEPELPVLGARYTEYLDWKRGRLSPKARLRQLDYWRGKLYPLPPPLALSPRRKSTTEDDRVVLNAMSVAQALMFSIAQYARCLATTPFVVMLAAFAALLRRKTGRTDFCIGTAIADRARSDAQQLVGYLTNVVTLRFSITDDLDVASYMRSVKALFLGAYAHQDVQPDEVAAALPTADGGCGDLFNVMFVLQDKHRAELALGDVIVVEEDGVANEAEYDLIVYVRSIGSSWRVAADHRVTWCTADEVKDLLCDYLRVLGRIVFGDGASLHEVLNSANLSD